MSNLEIIKSLMDIKAINVNTKNMFTWSSGIISPIYIDNRLIMSYPKLRTMIGNELKKLIEDKIPVTAKTRLFGTATAGIPHTMIVANLMNLPAGYVRSSQKKHGMRNNIEGVYHQNDRAIVIEDLISTGQSALQAAQSLREEKLDVLGIVSIFNYQLDIARQNAEDHKINIWSLINFEDLISFYQKTYNEEVVMILRNFHSTINQSKN